jgi:hypothetical protein
MRITFDDLRCCTDTQQLARGSPPTAYTPQQSRTWNQPSGTKLMHSQVIYSPYETIRTARRPSADHPGEILTLRKPSHLEISKNRHSQCAAKRHVGSRPCDSVTRALPGVTRHVRSVRAGAGPYERIMHNLVRVMNVKYGLGTGRK